jgi:hypothetical protein
MSILAEMVSAGFGVAMQMAGATVAYTRGSETIRALDAIPTEERYSVPNDMGIIQKIHSRDYLVEASELTIGRVAIEPRAGDRIIETISGQSMTFEVFPVDGDRCFRYRDASRQTLRIHTKRVA